MRLRCLLAAGRHVVVVGDLNTLAGPQVGRAGAQHVLHAAAMLAVLLACGQHQHSMRRPCKHAGAHCRAAVGELALHADAAAHDHMQDTAAYCQGPNYMQPKMGLLSTVRC